MSAYKIYKIASSLHRKKIPVVPSVLSKLNRIIYGCQVPHTAEIGENTIIGYDGIGTVIHYRSKIGKNCVIMSGVTLGGTNHKKEVPIIGDNVLIGTGAKLIGSVTIGSNVVIGANSVVVNDIPDNCLVVGVPAKVTKTNINIKDYL
ncbi:DapH/DapD/GlmU-related protein [Priestia megaterium]|uniref:serine O-acetyltransferase n=1 Tax=Priestia megaterium TaxID=1404 RepID=UPI002E205309|nr:DapH/DapD/GlmU-related protein [Priestia megaterium]